MENLAKIRFYKARPFGDRFSATFEFIGQNIKIIATSLMLVIGPFSIIIAILQGFMIKYIQSVVVDQFDIMSFTRMGRWGGILFLLLILVNTLNVSVIYNIMLLYNKKFPEEEIRLTDVVNAIWKDILPLIFLGILSFFIVGLGMILFVIPGIYLGVVLSLALPILFFERKGVLNAFDRCFKLVSDNWWSTFGLIIVSFIILTFIRFIVEYIVGLFSGLIINEEDGMEALMGIKYPIFIMISTFIQMLLNSLGYLVLMVVLAFQYFNLVEEKESMGLRQDISELESDNNDFGL